MRKTTKAEITGLQMFNASCHGHYYILIYYEYGNETHTTKAMTTDSELYDRYGDIPGNNKTRWLLNQVGNTITEAVKKAINKIESR